MRHGNQLNYSCPEQRLHCLPRVLGAVPREAAPLLPTLLRFPHLPRCSLSHTRFTWKSDSGLLRYQISPNLALITTLLIKETQVPGEGTSVLPSSPDLQILPECLLARKMSRNTLYVLVWSSPNGVTEGPVFTKKTFRFVFYLNFPPGFCVLLYMFFFFLRQNKHHLLSSTCACLPQSSCKDDNSEDVLSLLCGFQ